MQIRTPKDVGALIRSARRDGSLSQSELAKRVGVSQRWISQIENGKASAEIGKVLRALIALRVHLDAMPPRLATKTAQAIGSDDFHLDINPIVDKGSSR
jgi:HTH-type transcriptional regulator/antitoxin HipB